MKRIALGLAVAAVSIAQAEPPGFFVYISNGATDAVIGTYPVGKRPRGIRSSPDGRRVYGIWSFRAA